MQSREPSGSYKLHYGGTQARRESISTGRGIYLDSWKLKCLLLLDILEGPLRFGCCTGKAEVGPDLAHTGMVQMQIDLCSTDTSLDYMYWRRTFLAHMSNAKI